MSPSFDSSDDMHGDERFGNDPLRIDDDLVESMLNGSTSDAHFPEAYVGVGRMLKDLRDPSIDIADQDSQLAWIQVAVQSETPQIERKRRMIGNIVGVKVAAVAAGVLLSGGGVAAAATGNLPRPAQDAVARTVSHVGLDIPENTTTTTVVITTSTTSTTAPETTSTTTQDSSTSTTALKPGAEACREARAKEGAHGCSEVAHAAAPGQQKKAERSETSVPKKSEGSNGKKPEDKEKKKTTTTTVASSTTTTTTTAGSTNAE